jgi:hypothetical protein
MLLCRLLEQRLWPPSQQARDVPQVNHAVVHIRDRVRSSRGRAARRLNRPVARRACPGPALQLFARVLHSSQAALVVGASFLRVCALRAGRFAVGGRGVPRLVRMLLKCREGHSHPCRTSQQETARAGSAAARAQHGKTLAEVLSSVNMRAAAGSSSTVEVAALSLRARPVPP